MKLWIARSKKGALDLYYTKPEKFDGGFFLRSRYDGEIISWYSHNTEGEWMRLNPNLYPEVTYENSPQQVEVELKLFKEE